MAKERNKEEIQDQIKSERDHRAEDRTPLDEFDEQKFTDDIPLEDLKIDQKQEDKKEKSQDDSQSEEKYDADYQK